MSKLINKIRNYINQKFLIKYVDNKYWELVDNFDDKVETILNENRSTQLTQYYPALDLEKEKLQNRSIYDFIVHRASRYIYKVNDCLVDPQHNWVILGKKEIFRFSFPLVEDPWDGIKPRPSVLAKMLNNTPEKVDKAILVKYNWSNYYHFLVDTLSQIYLCDIQGIPYDVPVIVPYWFDKYAFVNDYLKEFPSKRRIIVQKPGVYFAVKELYVAKDTFFTDFVPQLKKDVAQKNIALQSPIESPELLFITRKKGIRRAMSNTEEIEKIAEKYGFKIVEPGNFTWKEQVKLFSNARKIIGVHGAGLTNLIFCNSPEVSLLEIFPGNGLSPEHYENISIQLNYKYSSIKGNGLDSNGFFSVDQKLFEAAVNKLMTT